MRRVTCGETRKAQHSPWEQAVYGNQEVASDGALTSSSRRKHMASQQLYSYLGRAGLWKNVSSKVCVCVCLLFRRCNLGGTHTSVQRTYDPYFPEMDSPLCTACPALRRHS